MRKDIKARRKVTKKVRKIRDTYIREYKWSLKHTGTIIGALYPERFGHPLMFHMVPWPQKWIAWEVYEKTTLLYKLTKEKDDVGR